MSIAVAIALGFIAGALVTVMVLLTVAPERDVLREDGP